MKPLPVRIEEDEGVDSEPTKVGGNVLVVEEAVRAAMTTPNDKATSKMNAFDLQLALGRVKETEPESGTRATIPFPVPEPMIEATRESSVDPIQAPMPEKEGSGLRVLAIIATIFIVMACAILLHH